MLNSPSTSTLWATTSKEWVIPAKPKPGRKPKKDSQQPTSEGEVEGKTRRAQNRTAQRAFRERKQHQLTDLKARLQLYEQGEIERNIALQAVSKRLKEENLALKSENMMLRAQVQSLQSGEPHSLSAASNLAKKKREAEEITASFDDCHRKRLKGPTNDSSTEEELTQHFSDALHAFPDLSTFGTSMSSGPAIQYEKGQSIGLLRIARGNGDFMGCGLCSTAADCLCRNLLDTQAPSRSNATTLLEPRVQIKQAENGLHCTTAKETSILDNLPAFQPAVALKRRLSRKIIDQPVFHVQATINDPVCSGDPKNCAACADDPFGQAFCAAFDVATDSMEQCGNCPKASCTCSSTTVATVDASSHPSRPHLTDNVEGFMSREKAWKVLKSHPNVPFADLRLLAEVVAKKSGCPGPETQNSPPLAGVREDYQAGFSIPRHGGVQYSENQVSGPKVPMQPALVPQNVLIECGKKRMITVREAGVREALRLLDARLV